MNYNQLRTLQGINAEFRNRTLQSIGEGTPRKLITMAASLVSRMVAEAKTRPEADAAFRTGLQEILKPLLSSGVSADIAKIARELSLYASLSDSDGMERRLASALPVMIACASKQVRDIAGDIFALEFQRRDALEMAYRSELGAGLSPVRSGHETLEADDLAGIATFLRQAFPEDNKVAIVSAELVAGGFSKQTAFLYLTENVSLPGCVVMRRDRARSALATSVVNEFNLLKKLDEAGVAVARPLALFENGPGNARPYMVTARAAGANIGDYWDVLEPSRLFALDLAKQLARLHMLPPELFGDCLEGASVPVRTHMEAEIEASYQNWRSLDHASPVAEAAFAWLRAHMDRADGRHAPVHGDVGCHNMLVEDGKITAIVDWEIARIGNPAGDIAYVRDTIEQCLPWDEFIDAYQAEGGVVPGSDELRFYSIWGELRNLVWTIGSGSIFFSGASDDLTLGYSGVYNGERLYHRLARKLATAGIAS